GRVQSVAVRIISERERAIRAFTPEEYWTVEARLEAGEPPAFAARLAEVGGQKLDHKHFRLGTKAEVDAALESLGGADWTVTGVERKERRRHPTPPFITSRLPPEASRKLGYQPSRTMRLAQRLSGEALAPYTLIWNRFVASQLSAAVHDATAVDVQAGSCRFRATGQNLKFDGFIRVYTEGRDDDQVADEETEGLLPPLAEGDRLRLLELVPEQHFTQPPPRFTQATLIKELE